MEDLNNQEKDTVKKNNPVYKSEFVTNSLNNLRSNFDSFLNEFDNKSIIELKDELREYRLQIFCERHMPSWRQLHF